MPSWTRLNGKRSMSPFTAGPAGDPAVAGHARLDCRLGHLGRKSDGPPGPQALWIGLQRARDLAWGCIWFVRSYKKELTSFPFRITPL